MIIIAILATVAILLIIGAMIDFYKDDHYPE